MVHDDVAGEHADPYEDGESGPCHGEAHLEYPGGLGEALVKQLGLLAEPLPTVSNGWETATRMRRGVAPMRTGTAGVPHMSVIRDGTSGQKVLVFRTGGADEPVA